MERDNYRDYNLIVDNEDTNIIGFYEDIIKYYKNVAKDYIDRTMYSASRKIIDLLELLGQAIDNEFIKYNDLIEIYYDEFLMKYMYNRYKKEL